jgi:hypothetical protein
MTLMNKHFGLLVLGNEAVSGLRNPGPARNVHHGERFTESIHRR